MRRLVLGVALILFGVPSSAFAQVPGDSPYERWLYFVEGRRSPGVTDHAERRQAARTEILRRMIVAAPPAGASARMTDWQPIGPERIGNDFTNATGRASTIAIHPENSDHVYIGGAQGGVWRTTDGGLNWTPLTDGECSLAMGSLAIDPVDPNIIYAGTGEQHFSGDSYYGCGVLRSTDGGDTWAQLAPQLSRDQIGKLAIDPSTAGGANTTVYVAARNGLFKSEDSGQTWSNRFGGIVTDVVLDPQNPQTVWIGVRGNGVHRSDDAGLTFERVDVFAGANVARIHLSFGVSDPTRFYAAGHDSDGTTLRLARSDNSGLTWTQPAAASSSCRQCWYDMLLEVDAYDPDIVYFGSVSLYKSTNGGTSFSIISSGIHVDQHFLISDPLLEGRAWVANDGGIYRSDDRGQSWTSMNTNLALTQFYGGISVHPSDPQITLGGTQDNGTMWQVGPPPAWDKIMGGDGGFTAMDPTNPDIQYMEFQWTGFGGPMKREGNIVRRSADGIDLDENGIFIPPIMMDPFEPNTLYFGATKVYKTTDAAESWVPLETTSTSSIRAIRPSVSDPNRLYYSTTQGQVWVTRDGGESFERADSGLPVRQFWDFAVHPTDPDIVWVVASGFGTGHVFRSSNGGESWTDVSGDLPDVPVLSIVLDPADPELAYIGTDLGVMVGGASGSWSVMGTGLPMVAIYDLAIAGGTGRLVAGTHGRGMWELPIDAPRSLVLRPPETETVVIPVTDPPQSFETRVGVYGENWTAATWTAETAEPAPWVRFESETGQGREFLRWELDPLAVPPGEYSTEIVVSVDGSDQTVVMPVAMEALFQVEVEPTSLETGVELPIGSTEVTAGEVVIDLSGTVLADTRWVASTASGASWLSLEVTEGESGEVLRWTRDPTGLPEGTLTETIVVSVEGFPEMKAEITDSFALLGPLGVAPPAVPEGGLSVSGLGEPVERELEIDLTGFGAGAATWTVSFEGDGWLELGQASGTGDGAVTWTESGAAVSSGDYEGTLRLSVDGHPDLETEIPVSFRALAPIPLADVESQVLTGAGVGADGQLVLDRVGNSNGVFDLGDLLGWVAVCTTQPAACGGGA